MASIIIQGDLPDHLPLQDDGAAYPFALAYSDRVVLATTRTELVADMIEGYADIPESAVGDEEALWKRYEAALIVANQFQQILAAQATENGTFDTQVESEDVLTAIFTPRNEKLGDVIKGKTWDHVVPLVLISTDYHPFTAETAPTGNVKWVNPFSETTYLQSLSDLGVVELFFGEEEQ